MKKLSAILLLTVLTLFLSIPAFAEGTTMTTAAAANTSTTVNTNANAYGANYDGNTTRTYATNYNRSNWGWLGLLGLIGLAGLRNRSRERER